MFHIITGYINLSPFLRTMYATCNDDFWEAMAFEIFSLGQILYETSKGMNREKILERKRKWSKSYDVVRYFISYNLNFEVIPFYVQRFYG